MRKLNLLTIVCFLTLLMTSRPGYAQSQTHTPRYNDFITSSRPDAQKREARLLPEAAFSKSAQPVARIVLFSLVGLALALLAFAVVAFQRSRQRRIHAASEALWGEFAIHTPAPGEVKRLSRLLIHFPEEDQLVLRLEGDGKKNSYYGALYTQTNQEILQLEKEETFLEQTSFAISDSQTYQVRQIIQQRQLLLQRRDLLQRLLGRHRTTQSRQLTRTGLEAPSYFRDSVSA